MKRFILLSFGFLGWAFYEMSGGADFEPASVRMAHLIPVTETELVAADDSATETPQEVVVAAATPTFVDTDPPLNNDVTRVSLNLTTLEDVLAEADPTDTVAEEIGTGVPVNVGVTLASVDTPAIIPSLIAPNDTGVADQGASLITSAISDLRTVSANRVNVRGGPGTDFGVVTKLVRGSEVEVIQDNGDGWVKMRPVDGGPEGWMADFLLAGG
ncbi:MAG: SH3 domain-containing protein [Sulfitobacter sp.]